jgi:MFS transporter, CP family, cyanate transporter
VNNPAPLAHGRQSSAAASAVIAAGVCAALHVAKLPPAIAALQAAPGLSLVQAGFMLSSVQVAGMCLGLAVGTAAQGLGARRSMLAGLLLLAAASALGAAASGVAALLVLRGVEGLGFLLVVLPAPGLLRQLVPAAALARSMGLWSAYMPLATALALLVGPGVLALLGWRGWWCALAAISALMAWCLRRAVPTLPALPAAPWRALVRQTLAAPGPWLLAACFALYAGQWLSVLGFLPLIYTQAGHHGAATALLTALVAAVNIAGNVGAGRLLQNGLAAARLLRLGFIAMALACTLAFAELSQLGSIAAPPPWLRYLGVLAFSLFGGLVPATLFALALRVAPSASGVATTVGWMQQGSACGQFVVPPLVAALAAALGGWHANAWVSLACALLALALIPSLVAAARR